MWDVASPLPTIIDDGTSQMVYGLGPVSRTTDSSMSFFLPDGLGSAAAVVDPSGSIHAG